MPRTIAPASLQPAASSRPASDADDDNTRVLQRVEAAVADPSGRLRLLLDNTNATSLPGFELAQLRGTLRELDCSNSPRLASLPMEIGHCFRTLTALNCSRCALTALPDEVGLLAHLAHLDCSYNQTGNVCVGLPSAGATDEGRAEPQPAEVPFTVGRRGAPADVHEPWILAATTRRCARSWTSRSTQRRSSHRT
jgi:hypothetical protein